MILTRFTSPLIVTLLLLSCTGEPNPSHESGHASSGDHEQMDHSMHDDLAMEHDEATGMSLYQVESAWTNRHGETLRLSDLQGKNQVVAMLYTHCEFACPRILADMKRIQQELSAGARQETGFLIISIDPERDTPERFTTFAEENDLGEDSWTLLQGEHGDVLEMAALLGVRYRRISETDFTHSNMLTVLDKEGEIVHRRTRLADSQEAIIDAIESL